MLVLGLANQTAFIGLQVAGLRTVGAEAGAAIVYVQPVLVVLGAAAFLGERLSARRLVGAAGVLFLLGAATAWEIGALVTSAAREPVMALLAGQHLVGAPLLVAGALLTEPLPPLSAHFALPVLFAGAFGSALAWGLWSVLLRRSEAGVVSTWLFAVPMLAAVLGVVLLGEPLTVELVAGIALVAIAVRLATASTRRLDGEDSVGIHLDTYHMSIEEDDFETSVRLVGDRLVHFHVSQSHRGGARRRGLCGDHARPDAVGYKGLVGLKSIVEMSPAMRNASCIRCELAGSDELVRDGLAYLRSLERDGARRGGSDPPASPPRAVRARGATARRPTA